MFRLIWGWATAVLGLAVIVLTYIDEAQLGVYFDEHAIFDNGGMSVLPSILTGCCGVVLIIGGIFSAYWRGGNGARAR